MGGRCPAASGNMGTNIRFNKFVKSASLGGKWHLVGNWGSSNLVLLKNLHKSPADISHSENWGYDWAKDKID